MALDGRLQGCACECFFRYKTMFTSVFFPIFAVLCVNLMNDYGL